MPHKDPKARAAWWRAHYKKNRDKILKRRKLRITSEQKSRWARTYRGKNKELVALWGRKQRKVKHEIVAGRPKPTMCEVCGEHGKICFDHDHITGKFRGWICDRCNRALGYVRDNPIVLRLLATYLEK